MAKRVVILGAGFGGLFAAKGLARSDARITVVDRHNLLDAVVGAIPLLGDVFDVAFKANLRNARLMDAYLDRAPLR